MATVAELKAILSVDSRGAEQAFDNISAKADGMGSKIGGAVQALAGVGLVLGGAVVAGASAAVASFAGFEQTVSAIGAVSGATRGELDALSAKALQLGKETSFSAKEAAEGMEELAKAGLSTADIIGGGAKAALDLAAAGGVKVGEAAAIASTAMTVFNKDASEMGGVVDRIAGFANATAGSVTDFKFAMSATGAVAKLVGANFEDTSTAISLMGKAGILGQDAGTSLKTMFMNLVPSTKAATNEMKELGIIVNGQNRFFDEQTGKLKSLDQVAGILQETVGGLSTEQQELALKTMFGTDAIRAAAIMTQAGSEGFRAMGEEITKVSATDVAKQRLNNLNGSIEQMKGSAETLAIMFGQQLAPGVRAGVDAVTEFLNALIDNQGLQDFIGQIGAGMSSAIQTGVAALHTLGDTLSNVFGAVGSTGGERAGFLEKLGLTPQMAEDVGAILDRVQLAFGEFANGWQAGFAALGNVAGEIGTFLAPIIENVRDWIAGQIPEVAHAVYEWGAGFIEWVAPQIGPMLETLGGLRDSLVEWIGGQVGAIMGQLIDWETAFIEWVTPAVPGLLDQLADMLGAVLTWIGQAAVAYAEKAMEWGEAFLGWVGEHIPPLLEALAGLGEAVLGWIGERVPMIVDQLVAWGEAFIQWVQPQIGPALDALGTMIQAVIGWIGDQLPGIMAQLAQWGEAFVQWVLPKIGPTIETLAQLYVQMEAWFLSTLASIVLQLAQWGLAFVEWVLPYIPQLLGKLGELQIQMGDWIIGTALPAIGEKLKEWAKAFVDWAGTVWGQLVGKLGELAGQLWGWINATAKDAFDKASAIGANLINGLVAGVQEKVEGALGAVRAAAGRVVDAAKAAFGVQSPSREFADIGEQLMLGLAQGIDSNAGVALSAVGDLADATIDAANTALDNAPSRRMRQVGEDMVYGLSAGVYAATDDSVRDVEAWINAILNAAQTAIGGSPSHVFSQLGEGAAKGFVLGMLGQQQDTINAALTLANSTADAFAGPITAKIGDLTTEQARKVRDALNTAAKAQQDAIDKTAVAQQKYADAVAKVGQKTHDQAVAAAQDAAIAADKAVEVAAKAARAVQEDVADALKKNADDAAAAAQKAADKAEKAYETASKRATDLVKKMVEENKKAAAEASKDFDNFVTGLNISSAKAVNDLKNVFGALIKTLRDEIPWIPDPRDPKVIAALHDFSWGVGNQYIFAMSQQLKSLQWMPSSRDPKIQKDLLALANGVADQYMQTVRVALSGGDYFTGHFAFLANEIASGTGAIGEFFTKTIKAFSEAGDKAGAALKDGVVKTIKDLNALGPLNLDNLLPQGLKGGFSSSLAAGNQIEASYTQQFAGMNFDQLKTFFTGYGLNPDYSQYQSGNQTLEALKTQLAGWFAGIMSSGLWSPTTGWRGALPGEESPYPSTGGIFGGTGATGGGTNSAGQSVENVTGETPKGDAPIGSRSAGPQYVTIPIYLFPNSRKMDEFVYDSQQRQIRRVY